MESKLKSVGFLCVCGYISFYSSLMSNFLWFLSCLSTTLMVTLSFGLNSWTPLDLKMHVHLDCWTSARVEMERDMYQQVSKPKYECLLFGEPFYSNSVLVRYENYSMLPEEILQKCFLFTLFRCRWHPLSFEFWDFKGSHEEHHW